MIQRLWSADLQWDEPVASGVRDDFQTWVTELETLAEIRVPRCYAGRGGSPKSYQLHILAYASQVRYAAAAFLQCQYGDGSSVASLVMSKNRLVPRDAPTLPRLELLAALLAVLLKEFLVKNLDVKVDHISLYTDSTIVYHWITSEASGKWKVFVANRAPSSRNPSQHDCRPMVPLVGLKEYL